MKKISASAMCFTFTGCFLGAGYVSGQELYQFFGAFGAAGIVGLFIAVAILGVFNVMLVRIVKSTGDTRIDRTVVGSENKTLLFLVGTAEMFIFFGTYVVMAAGAGALTEMLTGFNGAHIAGSFVFCLIISFIAVRGIPGLVRIFSGVVPFLIVMTLIIGVVTVFLNAGNGFDFKASEYKNPLIPNFAAGALTFASYNLFCSIGVLCPVGARADSFSKAVKGTVYGCVMLIFVAFSVLFSMSVLPQSTTHSLPMLYVAETISPLIKYVYALLLLLAMSGASLASLIPTVTYFCEKSKFAEKHGAPVIFSLSGVAFLLSCFGFADLVGTVFSVFGYVSLIAMIGIIRHFAKLKKANNISNNHK